MNQALLPPWTCVIGFILGTFFGSFLNMVIYRLPRLREGLNFGEPKRSFCPLCKHSLDWIDLMPIVSWLSTGGKCRYCKAPIAPRYLIVELITGLLWAGTWWRFMTIAPDPDVVSFLAFALIDLALVAIVFIDAELFIIPDELNAFILIVALIYRALTHQLPFALAGALLGWGLLWGIALLGRLAFGKDAMGDGDIKMMRGVGALIGPTLMLANLGVAVVLGLVGGIIGLILAKKVPQPEHSEESDEPIKPTPVWVVLLCGAWYFACLDVVALFVKPLDRWLAGILPAETIDEEDDWKPTATTIPFGPYLAAGALVCMLFGAQIETAMRAYWLHATGTG